MIIQKEELANFEKLYRTALINSLAGFRQAVLVGTVSEQGKSNLAIFNSLIHLGASPALYGIISRPDSVNRDTLLNIMETGEYTFNYIHSTMFKSAHQTSARYDRGVSEFVEAGLSEYIHPLCKAPFVQEAVVKIAMKLEERMDIALNGTTMIIGSVQHIELDESLLNPDGYVDLSLADVLITQGLDAYFSSKKIGRLPYAKPYNKIKN